MKSPQLLDDLKIKALNPQPDKLVRALDGLGLYLEINKGGTVWAWRLRVRRKGGETILTLGHYPRMSLAKARIAQYKARMTDAPTVVEASAVEPVPTFKTIALLWHEVRAKDWDAKYAGEVLKTLEKYPFPAFGDKEITAVEPREIAVLLKGLQGRGVMEVAADMRQRIRRVFSYAHAEFGLCAINPAANMDEVMSAQPASKPRHAQRTVDGARHVLNTVSALDHGAVVLAAHRFLAITAQRPGEVCLAQWDQFSGLGGPDPLWKIPAAQMKMQREHWVPLPRQAVALLAEIRHLTGGGRYCFPVSDGSPIDPGSLRFLLAKAGFSGKHQPHGWRSSFSTIMNERRRLDGPVIELSLAHVKEDKVKGAYDFAQHMPVRREIAQEWADLLTATTATQTGVPQASCVVLAAPSALDLDRAGDWEWLAAQ